MLLGSHPIGTFTLLVPAGRNYFGLYFGAGARREHRRTGGNWDRRYRGRNVALGHPDRANPRADPLAGAGTGTAKPGRAWAAEREEPRSTRAAASRASIAPGRGSSRTFISSFFAPWGRIRGAGAAFADSFRGRARVALKGVFLADIVLVNPRFNISYWGLEHALPLLAQAGQSADGLPAAAGRPDAGEHTITLVDENVEAIDFDRLARADIVGLTGMSVQRRRMREILSELKRRGVFTVVGGPWVTVQEDYFGALADVMFIGEAEETWPRFLTEWQPGRQPAATSRPSGPT